MNLQEEWRPVPGYENYQVSSYGQIRSIKTGKTLKPNIKKNGYHIVSLWSHNVQKKVLVHRVVAQAFLPNQAGLPEVNHRDEDKGNNRADNLEWCTHEYNMHYGSIREKMSAAGKGKEAWNKGKKCPQITAVLLGKPHQHKGTSRKKVATI